MFIRTYLVIALVLMSVGLLVGVPRPFLVWIVGGLGAAVALLTLATTLWETWNRFFGGRITRLLLGIRMARFMNRPARARALAARLVEAEGLTFDPNNADEERRLEALFHVLRHVNGHIPSAFGRLLPAKRVALLAWEVAGPEGADPQPWMRVVERIDRATRKIGIHPSRFTLLGRAVNEKLGRVLWGRALREVENAVIAGAMLEAQEGPRDFDDPAEDPSMIPRMIWTYVSETLPFYDLDDPGDIDLLPLPVQLRCIALHAALYGLDRKLRIYRLLFRRHADFLTETRALRERHMQIKADRAEENRRNFRAAGSESAEEIAALLKRFLRPAVYLRRAWPVDAEIEGQSWLGGQPLLPDSIAWPEHLQSGYPLHFLAQIDCRFVPRQTGAPALPEDGRLLFFADLDEDRLWEDTADAPVQTRVVHVPEDAVPEAPAPLPDKLPDIDHSDGRSGPVARVGQRRLAEWPVTLHPIRTYEVSTDKTKPNANPAFIEEADERFAQDILSVLPARPGSKRPRLFEITVIEDTATGSETVSTRFRADLLGKGFPYTGLVAKTLFGNARANAARRVQDLDTQLGLMDEADATLVTSRQVLRELTEDLDEVLAVIDTLDDTAPLAPPVQEMMVEFIEAGVQDETDSVRSVFETTIRQTLVGLARRAAADPSLRPLFDPVVYDLWWDTLAPHMGHSQHVLLGAAQRKAESTAAKGVKLLQLDSDAGCDFMFSDQGVVEFWIAPEDLAAHRFDRAFAKTADA